MSKFIVVRVKKNEMHLVQIRNDEAADDAVQMVAENDLDFDEIDAAEEIEGEIEDIDMDYFDNDKVWLLSDREMYES